MTPDTERMVLEALRDAERLYSTYGLLAQSADCGKWIGKARAAISAADREAQSANPPMGAIERAARAWLRHEKLCEDNWPQVTSAVNVVIAAYREVQSGPPMDDAVERVAQAICRAGGNVDGGCCYTDDCPDGCREVASGERFRVAQAAIAAYRQSLEDAGMVVVPREPTEAMLKAAWDSGWAATMTEDNDFSRWYRAMVAAAAPPADAK